MIPSIAGLLALSALVAAHGEQSQSQLAGPHQGLWYNTLPGDGGTQVSALLYQANPKANSTEDYSSHKLNRPTPYSPESRLSAAYPTTHVCPVMPRNTISHF